MSGKALHGHLLASGGGSLSGLKNHHQLLVSVRVKGQSLVQNHWIAYIQCVKVGVLGVDPMPPAWFGTLAGSECCFRWIGWNILEQTKLLNVFNLCPPKILTYGSIGIKTCAPHLFCTRVFEAWGCPPHGKLMGRPCGTLDKCLSWKHCRIQIHCMFPLWNLVGVNSWESFLQPDLETISPKGCNRGSISEEFSK